MDYATNDLESEIVKIRGHNLIHLSQRNRKHEEIADSLIEALYVDSSSDPFVDFMFSLPSLLQDPKKKFIIVANEPDIICEVCPVWQKENGKGCIGKYHYEGDKYCAESYGLELGKVYTSKELFEHMFKI